MQQATDFLSEAHSIAQILDPLHDQDFARATQFKGWTVNDILQHLHFFDRLAGLSVTDPSEFDTVYAALNAPRAAGMSLTQATDQMLDGLKGRALFAAWQHGTEDLAGVFAKTDPKARVKWVGPGMSARSSITARLMETWSHAQAIYDMLGLRRVNADRIANIARLGVNTFGWTFHNRGETVPEAMPALHLTAPSGALWIYGEANKSDTITGLAEEFCMVVTQTRNIRDTALKVDGPVASRWMEQAQCFAGPPRNPPPPGARYRVTP